MTVRAEETTGDSGPGAVSGAVITVLLSLVYAQNGDVGTAQALALAGERRSFAALRDTTAWSTVAEAVALFNAAALVTGDGAVGLHVGERLLTAFDGTDFLDRLVALGSPEAAFANVATLVDHFETESDATPVEVARDHALVRIAPRGAAHRHAHLCELTRGLLSRVPALFGRGPALISETECAARGGRFCLYALSWDDARQSLATEWDAATVEHDSPLESPTQDGAPRNVVDESFPRLGIDDTDSGVGGLHPWAPPAPDPTGDALRVQLGRLRAELDRMSVLVEGALATSAELLSEDLDGLLEVVANCADQVVGSHRYLLMVRVRPGAPLQLHHRGLSSDEAQALAAELWREYPDDGGGTRVIVDIASPRRLYGRLVAFVAPEESHPPSEVEALRFYAEYVATALEIFTVLTEARQSDATARTLLSFAEALSGVSTAAELVQLLAETTRAVAGSDSAAVFLWDPEQGRLIRRATSGGGSARRAGPEAIVPLNLPAALRRDSIGEPLLPVDIVPPDAPGPVPPGSPGARALSDPVAPSTGSPRVVSVRADIAPIVAMLNQREVVALDNSVDDPDLRRMLERSGTAAAVVAPLFASGTFLGVVSARYARGSSTVSVDDTALQERLAALADQAATTLQNLELLEKVSHMAWHDVLTGLPNRRLFKDRVEQELVRSRRVGEPVCMFFVDIDHFKTVNDTSGHAAGDELIRQVARRLVETVRRQDTVARVGGDEFAILLPGLADQLSIDQLAERTLEALSAPYLVLGEEITSSASIGIAMAPDHGDSYDELLCRADEAMYRAKSLGRNAYQMYAGPQGDLDTDVRAIDPARLAADLLHALDRNELFLLYQPYVDLRTDQVVGVEALIRWDHPHLGVLEPATFLPVAESSETIVSLDAWVLTQACGQSRTWLDHGLRPLRMSVNLATRDLSSPTLFDTIDAALEETGIDPTLLELEIPERVVLDRAAGPAHQNIERLRRRGVRFTIDNFGTGKSSMSRIGTFPVSTLKIDKSFIQVLGPDGEKNSLVSAIVSMADRLGLTCVAGGVETALQSRVLMQRGCTTAQGYYFSPPLPPAEVERMVLGIDQVGGFGQLAEGEDGGAQDGREGTGQGDAGPG